MHEYSIVSALMDRVQGECRRHGAVKVHRLDLRIGALAGIEPELLQSAWTLVREGTPCAEAEMAIDYVPARWACPRCAADIPAGAYLRCPACDEPARLLAGDEILLDRIEMEVP